MYGYIYETTNLINGKKYIGKHKANRFDESYYGSGIQLKKALNKYGKENFKVQILEEVNTNQKDLDKAETRWILASNAVRDDDYYNNSYGGESEGWYGYNQIIKENSSKHPMYGKHHSKETKLKISKSNQGKTANTANLHRITINNGIKEKHIYKEELDLYINQGWNQGRLPMSDETKQKISETERGKKVSIETREKMSKSFKGRIPWNKGLTKDTNEILASISYKAQLRNQTM